MTTMFKEEEEKAPELQQGSSPTVAPTQQAAASDGFGFAGGQSKAPTAQAAPAGGTQTTGGYANPSTFGFGAPAATGPAQGSTQGYMESGLNQWLQTPTRYDSSVVQSGANVIEQSLAKLRAQGKKNLDEGYANRGLIGSSVEAEGNREFEQDLQRQGQERLFNLQREQANTYAQDRGASLNAGLNYGQQGLQMLGLGMDNDLSYARMEQDAGFQNRAQELQAQGMTADDAYRQAALDWQKQYGTAELGVRKQGVDSQLILSLAQLTQQYPALSDMLGPLLAKATGTGGGGGASNYGDASVGQYVRSTGAGADPSAPSGSAQTAPTPEQYAASQNGTNFGFPAQSAQGGAASSRFAPGQYPGVATPGRPNYGVTQEAQRRLGMGQTQLPPMPNGVTSPVPGQTPVPPPPGGGTGSAPPPRADGTPYPQLPNSPIGAPPPQPYTDKPGITPQTGGTGPNVFRGENGQASVDVDALNAKLTQGGYGVKVLDPSKVQQSDLVPRFADPEYMKGLRENYQGPTLFREVNGKLDPVYSFANTEQMMEYFTNPEGMTGSSNNYKIARQPGTNISPNEWQKWVDLFGAQQQYNNGGF